MSALLLIDAGNTRLKWATALPGKKIRLRGDAATAEVTAARIKSLAREFLDHDVVLACVVPRLVPLFQRPFGQRLFILTGKSPALPVPINYPKPVELGADRLAAAIAAYAEGQWPAIIVSCGTASAFTVLDGKGRLCGGVIAPGLHTQMTALLGAAVQLPATDLRAPQRLPARSTQEAIRAGVLLSFQGGVREIVAGLSDSLPARPAPRLLLTGGNAPHLRGVLGPGVELRPLLVFEGLRIMGSRLFSA